GVIEDLDHVTRSGFQAEGDEIVLLGRNTDELGGSEYLKAVHGLVAGDAPAIDLEIERRLQQTLLAAIRSGLIRSAHDRSGGGLAIALAESAIADAANPVGLEVRFEDDLPPIALLYGEAQSRVVISVRPELLDRVLSHFADAGVEARHVGRVGPAGGRFRIETRELVIDLPVEEVARTYYDAIPRRMDGRRVDVATALDSEVYVP